MTDQQNLARIGLAIVILRARNSRLVSLRPLIPELLQALDAVRAGHCYFVGPA